MDKVKRIMCIKRVGLINSYTHFFIKDFYLQQKLEYSLFSLGMNINNNKVYVCIIWSVLSSYFLLLLLLLVFNLFYSLIQNGLLKLHGMEFYRYEIQYSSR